MPRARKAFQFQKVRLKVRLGPFNVGLVLQFQFQKVRLKDSPRSRCAPHTTVSIPKGSIKRKNELVASVGDVLFQFQKVRLKGCGRPRFGLSPRVSIPKGSIKSKVIAIEVALCLLFQFQKVRLKVLIVLFANIWMLCFNSKRFD